MKKVYNFSSGPSSLPKEVIMKFKKKILNWRNSKLSIMEINHRSELFLTFILSMKNKVKKLLKVPENYKIFFMTSPSRASFSSIPLNFIRNNLNSDYLVTGLWSFLASEEAKKYCKVNVVSNTRRNVENQNKWKISRNPAYFYYTPNETIEGTQLNFIPDTGLVPLVADMTSCLFSEKIDISKFGCIYSGAQKNFGPSGVTLTIIRKDLLNRYLKITPDTMNYTYIIKNNSVYYTPSNTSYYLLDLMLDWINNKGGVSKIYKRNLVKAKLIYNYIDSTDFYINSVKKKFRSLMNVSFNIINKELEHLFLNESNEKGFLNLKGHLSIGGLRIGMYNSISIYAIKKLINFMKYFEKKYG